MNYHLRRKDKEITDEKHLKKILSETHYVTLAMVKDNEPYLVSMSHAYDPESHSIYIHSAGEGKKLDYLRATPSVWGQAMIDHGYHVGECTHLYASVMFKAKAHFIEDKTSKQQAFRAMINQIEPNPDSMMDRLTNSEGIARTAVIRLEITHMSGKKSAEVEV